ncbi:MAG: ABC transporter permease [Hyphomicrobiaceae bacterium]|nr:ABC transporter permease [Hyphomicrobiaceae bacterium]
MRITSTNAAFLMLGPVAFFVLFFLAPFSVLVGESFMRPDGGWTLANYTAVLGDAYYWGALLNTLLIAFWVSVVCFLLGYPLAYYTIFHARSVWVRRLIYVLLVTPLFTSNIVRAFGWIVILGRRGIVNESLLSIGLIETPLDILYSKLSIITGLAYILLPVMVLSVCSVLQGVDRSLIEAARDLGARPSRAFLAVTFPLSLPGVVAGSIIVFALSVSAYVIPSILSGGREMVTPILIFQQYTATFRPDIGATLSVVLLAVTLLLIGAYLLIFERRVRMAG